MFRLLLAALPLVVCKLCFGDAGKELEARKLIERQQFSDALSILDKAQTNEPDNVEIRYLRGYTLYRLRDLGQARPILEECVRRNPPALRSRYILGRIALLEGHSEEAVQWLLLPAQQKPPIEDSAAQLSKAYFDTHQVAKSKNWTERALSITPWDGSLHYRLARLYQQSGENEKALGEFRASLDLKIADGNAVEKLITSSQEIARGDFDKARETRRFFLEQKQCDPDVLVALGSSFAGAGKPEDATELFTEAARRDPSSFQAHFDLGLALLRMGRTVEAVEPLETSAKIAPTSMECRSALGLGYVLLGRFKDALPELEVVHTSQPANPRTEGLLALTYLRTNAAGKAVPIIRALMAKQNDDPKLYFLLIECLNSVEEQGQALGVAEEAVRRFPKLAKANLAEAQQLARLGRYEEAGPLFAKAIEEAPQDIEPLLGLAEVQNKAGVYAESLRIYQRSLELDPRNLTGQLGSAKDLVSLGRLAEAREALEKASNDHADSSQVHLELSRVYARLGAKEEAAKETALVQRLKAAGSAYSGSPQ